MYLNVFKYNDFPLDVISFSMCKQHGSTSALVEQDWFPFPTHSHMGIAATPTRLPATKSYSRAMAPYDQPNQSANPSPSRSPHGRHFMSLESQSTLDNGAGSIFIRFLFQTAPPPSASVLPCFSVTFLMTKPCCASRISRLSRRLRRGKAWRVGRGVGLPGSLTNAEVPSEAPKPLTQWPADPPVSRY